MSETDPAIIQGGHPFKVEAVLSKTGGVNALAKHAPALLKGDNLGSNHREAIPSEGTLNDHRIQLDASLPDNDVSTAAPRQDAFDTQHREQFVDPSRRLKTRQRIKIQGSEGPSPNTAPSSAESAQGAENNALHAQARKTATALAAEAQQDREQFHRRIEQIKSNNESVGKDLEALEKSTPQRGGLKPAE